MILNPTAVTRLFIFSSLVYSCNHTVTDLNANQSRRIIEQMAVKLDSIYIDQNAGRIIGTELSDWYQSLPKKEFSTTDFINNVNKQLYEISDDKHLRLYRNLGTPGHMVVHGKDAGIIYESKSEKSKQILNNGKRLIDYELKAGISDVRLLENNIGYLALFTIPEEEQDKAVIDDAFKKLKDTHALIIDIGVNMGGAPFGVRHISSYMFREKTHLTSFKMRGMSEVRERWTSTDGLVTTAFFDKPIYILSSPQTISASESLLFGLKTKGRIIQVGERTAGGGRFGETHTISSNPKIDFWISAGETFDPATGKGWEATGIQPDIEVSYPEALSAAIAQITQKN